MKKSLKLLISFHQIFFLFYFPQLILFNSLSCSSYIFFSNFLRILLFFINSLYHVAVNFRDTSFEFLCSKNEVLFPIFLEGYFHVFDYFPLTHRTLLGYCFSIQIPFPLVSNTKLCSWYQETLLHIFNTHSTFLLNSER